MVAQLDFQYIRLRPTKAISRLISYALFEGRPITTRGRWINPLVLAHMSVEKHLPQLKSVYKPIFIVGVGRSGTTALGTVLSMHKDVGFLNEPKALWHTIYPHEDVIGSYHNGIAKYRLIAEDATQEVIRNAHRLFGAYLAVIFSTRLVDKYPELIFRAPFVKRIFPDAKFLFLVRNGWDACYSIALWSQRLGTRTLSESNDWWGVNKRKWRLLVDQLVVGNTIFNNHIEEIKQWTNPSDMAALEWIITMQQGMELLNTYSDDVLMIKYEELSRLPREKLIAISEFCELTYDPIFLEYGEKSLHPVFPHETFELSPLLLSTFKSTMQRLGYKA